MHLRIQSNAELLLNIVNPNIKNNNSKTKNDIIKLSPIAHLKCLLIFIYAMP